MRIPRRMSFLLAVVAIAAGAPALHAATPSQSATPVAAHARAVPRFSHVVEVMLENESATATFEDATAAPALHKLLSKGLYLPRFYAEGHASLDNYMASFG